MYIVVFSLRLPGDYIPLFELFKAVTPATPQLLENILQIIATKHFEPKAVTMGSDG